MFRLITFLLLSLPGLAFATSTTTSTIPPAGLDGAVQTAGSLWAAIQTKNWPLAVGLGLMILIWGLKTTGVLDKIKLGSKAGIRASALILSVLTAIGAGLIQGLPALEIVLNTAEIATAAVGGWEFIGKALQSIAAKEAEADSRPEAPPTS